MYAYQPCTKHKKSEYRQIFQRINNRIHNSTASSLTGQLVSTPHYLYHYPPNSLSHLFVLLSCIPPIVSGRVNKIVRIHAEYDRSCGAVFLISCHLVYVRLLFAQQQQYIRTRCAGKGAFYSRRTVIHPKCVCARGYKSN